MTATAICAWCGAVDPDGVPWRGLPADCCTINNEAICEACCAPWLEAAKHHTQLLSERELVRHRLLEAAQDTQENHNERLLWYAQKLRELNRQLASLCDGKLSDAWWLAREKERCALRHG